MPKGLISGKFNERIRMKRFWSCLKSIRNKSTRFSCLDIATRPLFRVVPLSKIWKHQDSLKVLHDIHVSMRYSKSIIPLDYSTSKHDQARLLVPQGFSFQPRNLVVFSSSSFLAGDLQCCPFEINTKFLWHSLLAILKPVFRHEIGGRLSVYFET